MTFYFHNSDKAVGTKKLTRSFGQVYYRHICILELILILFNLKLHSLLLTLAIDFTCKILTFFRSHLWMFDITCSKIKSIHKHPEDCFTDQGMCDCFSPLRWETLDSFMQHDVQELCRVVRL